TRALIFGGAPAVGPPVGRTRPAASLYYSAACRRAFTACATNLRLRTSALRFPPLDSELRLANSVSRDCSTTFLQIVPPVRSQDRHSTFCLDSVHLHFCAESI